MNYLNTATLTYILFVSLLITAMAFSWKVYKNTSKNALYFCVSSVFALITVMFVCVLVLVLPKTDKEISSVKCIDYQTAYRELNQYVPEIEPDKVLQIEIMQDNECETPYLEIRENSVVLEVLQVFEVRKETRYILHMPPKQQEALNEEVFD